MPRRVLPLCLVFVSSVASATSWSAFAPAFPVFPCVDGWSSCQTGEGVLSAEPRPSGDARTISGSRLEWFTLRPSHGFDAHTDVLERSPEDVPQASEPEAVPAPPDTPAVSDAVAVVDAPDPQLQGKRITQAEGVVTPRQVDVVPVAPDKQVDEGKGQLEKAAVVVPKAVAPSGDAVCSDLLALRGPAGVGRLSDGQVACLERTLAETSSKDDKVARSLVLIQNAWSADKAAWERLTRRHLSEIDDSDPDLAYRFARVQMRKGAAGAPDVLRWTASAQSNKTRWSGASYRKKVYDLHKLETMAEQSLLKAQVGTAAEAQHQQATQAAARSWFIFAEGAELDSNTPLTVCLAAGGERDWCVGA